MGDVAFKSSHDVHAWVGAQREYLNQKQRDAVEAIINEAREGHGWLTHDDLTKSPGDVLQRLRVELRDKQVIAAATYDKLAKRLESLYA
jgi:hypothetical protein